VQEKIVKIMATTQAILLMCCRISKMMDDDIATMGQIAMTKAWVTERGREVAKWGREVYGGNGIVHNNYVMKAMADMEAIYTYDGTYDINTLIAGRELTGLAAFKK
jgi:acyl-CoA oxidase